MDVSAVWRRPVADSVERFFCFYLFDSKDSQNYKKAVWTCTLLNKGQLPQDSRESVVLSLCVEVVWDLMGTPIICMYNFYGPLLGYAMHSVVQ